jgi:hypothetical protein
MLLDLLVTNRGMYTPVWLCSPESAVWVLAEKTSTHRFLFAFSLLLLQTQQCVEC